LIPRLNRLFRRIGVWARQTIRLTIGISAHTPLSPSIDLVAIADCCVEDFVRHKFERVAIDFDLASNVEPHKRIRTTCDYEPKSVV
jgi:hypothetical protein